MYVIEKYNFFEILKLFGFKTCQKRQWKLFLSLALVVNVKDSTPYIEGGMVYIYWFYYNLYIPYEGAAKILRHMAPRG